MTPKLTTKFSVTEVSNVLHVDSSLVKKWTFLFSDYLNPRACPEKGVVRQYNTSDIRVFAFVYSYWEDNPDIESIKMDLNANCHYQDEAIGKLIISLTPLFQEMPEGIDENWKGRVFGGEFELDDLFNTAKSYKLAGDRLTDSALIHGDHFELFQPIIFNYRHSIELFIKSITGEEITHNLKELYSKLKLFVKKEFEARPPNWVDNFINVLNYSDPKGTAFRYGMSNPKEELYADLEHIKKKMNWMETIFIKTKVMIENKSRYG